jgi:phosphotransferase system HPr (HPr) family protein
MQVAELEVHNESGLHARPAATFVKTAAGFHSRVSIQNLTRGAAAVNAKSLLAVLGCGVEQGHTIRVSAEGDDEEAAITALRALAEGGFGEAVAG